MQHVSPSDLSKPTLNNRECSSEVAHRLLDVEVSAKSQNMSCCFRLYKEKTKGPKSFVLHHPESSEHVETVRISLGSQHSSSLYCYTVVLLYSTVEKFASLSGRNGSTSISPSTFSHMA